MEYHDVTRSEGEKSEEHSGAPRPSERTLSHDIAPKYKADPDIEEDIEKGKVAKSGDTSSEEQLPRKIVSNEDLRNEEELDDEPGAIKTYWRRYRPLGHAIIWLLVTAYGPLTKKLLIKAGGSVDLSCIATNGSSQLSSTSPSVSGSSSLMSL